MKGQKNENTAVFMLNEGFEITYTDKTTGEFFPAAKSGEHCYRALWNRNEPCEDCPVTEDAGDLSGAYYKGEYTISYKPMTCADGSRTYMVSACKNTLCGSDEDRLDSLTGLYRPEGFKNAAAQLLENDERDFFIAYIDIEHFKLYNDWYGYEAGDALLVSLAKLVKEKAAAEYGVACHFGSDDFVLLLPDINDNAQRLINDVKKWTDEAELEINFTPVIGLYRITDRTVSIDLMCDFASLAMNNCKGDYTTPYKWYEQDMRRKLEEEQELFAEAKKALERREFKVYFQPKCNMADGKIVGNEALVRWPHLEKGMISPGKFIPVLENNGFIYRLDLYVWEEVCRYQRRLLDKGITPLPVSVNVSRVDIYKENVPEMFNALIEKYRLPPELIELEITESAYMSDYRQLEGVVKDLRQRGFTVLMDDFGSGYSSLNVLKDIEVDIIKIDMKFLEMSEETRQKGGSILESIIRMAKWLGYRVIAEGTETDEQVDGLLKMGCQYGQGYHFYRPMPYEDYEKLSEKEKKLSCIKKAETPNHKPPKNLRIGDSVKVLSMNLKGTVHTLPNAKGDLYVQMGILRSLVNINDLILIDEDALNPTKKYSGAQSKIKMSKSASVSTEINLIGMLTDEAVAKLDKYLDDAYIAHLPSVRIVHGKGTGALRNAVHTHLKRLNYIKEFHLGEFGEGDAGVTIATFK